MYNTRRVHNKKNIWTKIVSRGPFSPQTTFARHTFWGQRVMKRVGGHLNKYKCLRCNSVSRRTIFLTSNARMCVCVLKGKSVFFFFLQTVYKTKGICHKLLSNVDKQVTVQSHREKAITFRKWETTTCRHVVLTTQRCLHKRSKSRRHTVQAA